MKSSSKRVSFIMAVIMILSVLVSSFAFADNVENTSITAKANSSTVLVNGTKVDFESYNINDNNYFKLRDLAKILSGTEKQFEVIWNNDNKAIELISNTPYTEVGGELAAGDGVEKPAQLNSSIIFKDGEETELEAYTINDNNYFKLRDIAEVFDIGVTWDGDTKTVGIDTSLGYETTEPDENNELDVNVEPTEENTEATEEEVRIESASIINNYEILVKLNKPLPASKAGEYYSAFGYLDYDSMSPWEMGFELNLIEGESEFVIDLSRGTSEFEFPGTGMYEIFITNREDVESSIDFEVTEDMLQ
ncbi:MAG: hypothetical protein GX285_00695 [Clostridiales bacterium]|nr:hypothetical protein [Clostridiales bacterium]